jgi:hypothetical protein
MEEQKDAVTERLKGAIINLKSVVEVITDKAIERAILIEDTTKELDALALDIEGKETKLLGGEKIEFEAEIQEQNTIYSHNSPV